MGRRIADVMELVPISGTRKFYDVVAKMEGVVSLSVGEPDFKTPDPIRQTAANTLSEGRTKYTTNAGLPELRREVSDYMRQKFNLEYSPNQILTTVGASGGVFSSLRAIIDPGDEILVPEPSYVSYKPTIYMAGGIPVVIETKAANQFRLQPEELLEKITPRTKAILLSYPNNPTGAIMDLADLEKIAAVLRDRDILVISDEVYSELTYGRRHVSIANIDGMQDRTIIINGFSKTFSMTGWRLGFACGPEDIIGAMLRITQYVTMSAATTSQYGGIEALRSCQDSIEYMRQEYDKRRQMMLKGFRDIGMDCFEPLGAFYIFPSIRRTGLSSDTFTLQLLNKQKVEVISGSAFGESGEGFIRCSYAYSIENIEEGLRRIARFMEDY